MELCCLPGVSLLLLICVVTSAAWHLMDSLPRFYASYETYNTVCYEHFNYYHNACDPNIATTPMSRDPVSTLLACSAMCQLKNGCLAFYFAPGSEGGSKGVCLPYNVTSKPLDMSCDGSMYGQLEMGYNCRPGWRSVCVNDVDCTGIRRMCRSGKCTCESGYMFEPRSGNCVAECQEYGDTFSRAWATFLETPDNITITDITPDECEAECLKANCRSYQYQYAYPYLTLPNELYQVNERTCVLSNLTVVTAEPNSISHVWFRTLYQRECVKL